MSQLGDQQVQTDQCARRGVIFHKWPGLNGHMVPTAPPVLAILVALIEGLWVTQWGQLSFCTSGWPHFSGAHLRSTAHTRGARSRTVCNQEIVDLSNKWAGRYWSAGEQLALFERSSFVFFFHCCFGCTFSRQACCRAVCILEVFLYLSVCRTDPNALRC